jgi:hypothetical protein
VSIRIITGGKEKFTVDETGIKKEVKCSFCPVVSISKKAGF